MRSRGGGNCRHCWSLACFDFFGVLKAIQPPPSNSGFRRAQAEIFSSPWRKNTSVECILHSFLAKQLYHPTLTLPFQGGGDVQSFQALMPRFLSPPLCLEETRVSRSYLAGRALAKQLLIVLPEGGESELCSVSRMKKFLLTEARWGAPQVKGGVFR